MWKTATATSSVASRSLRQGQHRVIAATTTTTRSRSRRSFSDNRGGGGVRGRGGGGGGRGGGRGTGSFSRFREQHAKNRNKPNFDKTVLQPAAEGHLSSKHDSGIPRLTARKHKSLKPHDQTPGREAEEMQDMLTQGEDEYGFSLLSRPSQGARGPRREGVRVVYQPLMEKPVLKAGDPDYDSEDEHDDFDDEEEHEEIMNIEDHQDITKEADGSYSITYDSDEDEDTEEDANVPMQRKSPQDRQQGSRKEEEVDPEEAFFCEDFTSLTEAYPEIPREVAKRVLPLRDHGPGLEGFLEANIEHPSEYAEVVRINRHPDSEREPKPDFAKKVRAQPPLDFVESHIRFIYVTGLPIPDGNGEEADFKNPLHRHEIVKLVCEIFNVETEHVSPANLTSAFIGFETKKDFREAMKKGPSKKSIVKPVRISKHTGGADANESFSGDAVVTLSNLPPGMNESKLASALFPANTEVGKLYGPITADQLKMTSPTTALLHFASPEQAESAVFSDRVQTHLASLGTSRVRYFKAKRELLNAGYAGPNKWARIEKRGSRLFLSGDVPSKDFYRSHAGVLALRNLDLGVTKKDIAKYFQPHCRDIRDVAGSVEFVTCAEGLRTDRAYVGFDEFGEAEAFLKTCSGLIRLGSRTATVRLVHEKARLGVEIKHEPRPARTTEEILDSLNNWEKFVDPKDLEELEELGVRREVLDSTFRSMRFHNRTFGPTDLALTREKLEPEREAGDGYREVVQMYIETLKECKATPENPGWLYEGMFSEGEEVDLSIFDEEKERQARLRRQYEGEEV